MKTIVPFKQNFVTLVLLVLSVTSCMYLQAQSGSQTSLELSFSNSTLYSGTAGSVGAIYRFRSVNSNLDAFIKINDRSSSQVKLENIDITNTGFTKAFQPQISYGNGSVNSATTWWMEFEISFVNKNTTTPATISTFQATALDIDGDNNRLREQVSFESLASYTMENNSLLQVNDLTQLIQSLPQNVGKTFTAPTTQYSGIDTTQTSVMTTVTYNNTSSFKFRAGATTSGSASSTDRMYSLWFKDFTYTAPIITSLPVRLISFTATLNQNKADLKWSTASEINVSHFVVEKSYDGKNFNDAGIVFAYGNTSERVNYSLSDNISNVQQGVVYYRLRSVDNDGKSQLSEIRIIRISKQGETLKMVTYPNPVSSELRVTVPAAWQGKEVLFELFNQSGQRVKATERSSSSQTESIIVNDLAKGFYLLKATCGTDVAQQKLIKY